METPDPIVSVRADVLGGTPCFTGTRVPVVSLFDYLEGGYTIDEFLEQFPRVTREQAQGLLVRMRKYVEREQLAGAA
jgi:uncharacterized protein (DUF433 family)